ncbi:hypothetical protein DSO57_1039446 [Entomophthora muscae]|uniref:Uncharacterized protein n=1 Tax=Entomophthora muscae TaxID=34485 RepID=A0ACC2UJ50_9FUNG|nr:hypothetical protein DSO57_1039446 [Entomophthora muscae]
MGTYISKLSIHALVISHIAIHGSAAPDTTQDIESADTYVLTRDISLSEIRSDFSIPRDPLFGIRDI